MKTFSQDRRGADAERNPSQAREAEGAQQQQPGATFARQAPQPMQAGGRNTPLMAARMGDPVALAALHATAGNSAVDALASPQPLAQFNPDVAARIKTSTGIDVSDATVEVDPHLDEQGKQGAAEDDPRIHLASQDQTQEMTLCHKETESTHKNDPQKSQIKKLINKPEEDTHSRESDSEILYASIDDVQLVPVSGLPDNYYMQGKLGVTRVNYESAFSVPYINYQTQSSAPGSMDYTTSINMTEPRFNKSGIASLSVKAGDYLSPDESKVTDRNGRDWNVFYRISEEVAHKARLCEVDHMNDAEQSYHLAFVRPYEVFSSRLKDEKISAGGMAESKRAAQEKIQSIFNSELSTKVGFRVDDWNSTNWQDPGARNLIRSLYRLSALRDEAGHHSFTYDPALRNAIKDEQNSSLYVLITAERVTAPGEGSASFITYEKINHT